MQTAGKLIIKSKVDIALQKALKSVEEQEMPPGKKAKTTEQSFSSGDGISPSFDNDDDAMSQPLIPSVTPDTAGSKAKDQPGPSKKIGHRAVKKTLAAQVEE